MKPFFSIAIPTYEMHGLGKKFLSETFSTLHKQTFKDFEVVISDHSKNDEIYKICQGWQQYLDIKYFKNNYKVGSSSANINNAITKSNGEWIKILFQDDFFFSEKSLENLKNFLISDKTIIWVASACEHSFDGINLYKPFYPSWNKNIHLGINTISSPSVITIKNQKNKLLFDEDLIWLMDVDFYKKMYETYGEPRYYNEINIVNRTWEKSISNTLSEEIKKLEINLLNDRYK